MTRARTSPPARADVVIVGGGPVGLAAAHCLDQWGIGTALLERRTGPSRHPRATLVNVRTMELLRLLGVAEQVVRAGVPLESTARITWVSTLAGEEIGGLEIIESADKLMRLVEQGPVLPAICPQNRLEAILADSLAGRPGARAAFGRTVTGIEASPDDGVRVRYRKPKGGEGTIRAAYAVLAEGLHGDLRAQVGIDTLAEPPLGRLLDIHFIADLSGWTRGRESALYWVVNPRLRGVVISVDPARGEWLLEVPALGDEAADLFDPDLDHAALVAEAIGATVRPEIRSVRAWSMGTTAATRWRDASGRVFVAGDAAHTFPPTGGFGMNTGIQDVHNLAWKLAATLRGWADPQLLDTYEADRRPVAEFNAQQSERNALQMRDFLECQAAPYVRALTRPGPGADRVRAVLAPLIEEHRPHFDFSGQALGFRYRPVERGAGPRQPAARPEPVVADVVTYHPSTEAGARAPHAWLDNDRERLALADWTIANFALFTPVDGAARWSGALSRARTGAPVTVVAVAADPTDPAPAALAGDDAGEDSAVAYDATGGFAEAYRLHVGEAVLVRPDGHIAARLPGTDPDTELARALSDSSILVDAKVSLTP